MFLNLVCKDIELFYFYLPFAYLCDFWKFLNRSGELFEYLDWLSFLPLQWRRFLLLARLLYIYRRIFEFGL